MSAIIDQSKIPATWNQDTVLTDAVAVSASSEAGIGSIKNIPGLPLPAAREGLAQESPALDSLLSMMNLQTNPATLELYLAEIIQTSRDTANTIGKNRIDFLTNNKLSILKEKQQRLEEAQKKLDEAEKIQADSKIWSWIRFGVSLLTAAASLALIATGVGAGAGVLMLGFTIATVSALNEGVALASNKGIAGHVATAFGASKNSAMWVDTAFSITLTAASLLLLFGPFGLTAVPAAVSAINAAGGLTAGAIGIKNAVSGFSASDANATGLKLNGLAKEYEALIQQLDGYLQHATDSIVSSNNRNNEVLATLLRTYSDVSNAMSRVRFAS